MRAMSDEQTETSIVMLLPVDFLLGNDHDDES